MRMTNKIRSEMRKKITTKTIKPKLEIISAKVLLAIKAAAKLRHDKKTRAWIDAAPDRALHSVFKVSVKIGEHEFNHALLNRSEPINYGLADFSIGRYSRLLISLDGGIRTIASEDGEIKIPKDSAQGAELAELKKTT